MFKRPKVLIVGDLMLDRYIVGKSERLSPEAPVPVVEHQNTYEMPGGAANVALNFEGMEASVFLCGFVGNDKAGHSLINLIESTNIDGKGILFSPFRRTTEKIRILSNDRQILRVDREDRIYLNEEEEQKLLKVAKEIIDQSKPDILILQDYNKGVLTPMVIKTLLEIAGNQRIFTAVDPKYHHFFDYQKVDLFKPNFSEFKRALNLKDSPGINEVMDLAPMLLNRLGCKQLMITLSESGIYAAGELEGFVSQADPEKVKDVSGAGDTVLCVASLALFSGYSLQDAAWLSNRAAGIVCGKHGVVPIELREICKVAEKQRFTYNK